MMDSSYYDDDSEMTQSETGDDEWSIDSCKKYFFDFVLNFFDVADASENTKMSNKQKKAAEALEWDKAATRARLEQCIVDVF